MSNEMDEMDEKPEECEGCGFETPDLKPFDRSGKYRDTGKKWLCDLCSRTPAGVAIDYPTNAAYEYIEAVLRQNNYVANVLLLALREAGK